MGLGIDMQEQATRVLLGLSPEVEEAGGGRVCEAKGVGLE